jgi:hypothetical protein
VPGTWSAGGNLITGREAVGGAGETQTSAFVVAGSSDAPAYIKSTEEYDGSAWASGGDAAANRAAPGSCGTPHAGLLFGGVATSQTILSSTEEYDGASWASGGSMATARNYVSGMGTQTAGLACRGCGPGENVTYETCEEYNGTAWASGGSVGVIGAFSMSAGTQTAGLLAGGIHWVFLYYDDNTGWNVYDALAQSTSYEYDGASWASGGALPATNRVQAGCGTQANALSIGGIESESPSHATYEYNGTSWASGGDLSQTKTGGGGAGAGASDGLTLADGSPTQQYTPPRNTRPLQVAQ